MEIPYELKPLRYYQATDFVDQNYYIILNPKSLFYCITKRQMYILKEIINDLGKLSNEERQLFIPKTDFFEFIFSDYKKIILKCREDIIIGYIYFKENPLFLFRNFYNLNFLRENFIKILDFYIFPNYRRMNHGKQLFDKVIYMTGIKPNLMDFFCPNKAFMNFLEKNYGFVIHTEQFNNIINIRNMNRFNDGYDKMFNSEDAYKNKFQLNSNDYNQNYYNQNRFYARSNKRYDNIENNYIKGFNINNNSINNINNKINYESSKILRKNNPDFHNNIRYPNEFQKDNYNNYLNQENIYKGNKFKNRQNPSQVNIISYHDIKERLKNAKINNSLEDMCIQGEIITNELRIEKIKHPERFIETSQALKMEKTNKGIFALGLISKNLQNLGIETAIIKDSYPQEENKDLNNFQFLINGMIEKKKYNLHFELGEKRNNELLKNKNEYNKFKEKLKLKISKDYNIPSDKIVISLPKKGGFHLQLIFQSDEFNNLNKEDFLQKFKNDPNFPELQRLKDIQEDTIMGAIRLTPNQLDPKGNRKNFFGKNLKRGGKDYFPPLGWNGIGIKVENRYDNGDNTWLGMKNIPGEWCVAYHGVGQHQESDKVKYIVGEIIKNEFKVGPRQKHKDCPDKFHPKQKVGEGVYCTPDIKAVEKYAGKSEINGIIYKTVLMVRVKPDAIRHCDKCLDSRVNNYWVVNGTNDEIRPYRILFKKCRKK